MLNDSRYLPDAGNRGLGLAPASTTRPNCIFRWKSLAQYHMSYFVRYFIHEYNSGNAKCTALLIKGQLRMAAGMQSSAASRQL